MPSDRSPKADKNPFYGVTPARGPLPSFVGTVSEAIDLIGQYQDAGLDLLIYSDPLNDVESRGLFVSDVMPHFA